LRSAVELGPSATTHYNLGRCLVELGQVSEAERHFLEALKLDPDFTLAQCERIGCRLGRESVAFYPHECRRFLEKLRPSAWDGSAPEDESPFAELDQALEFLRRELAWNQTEELSPQQRFARANQPTTDSPAKTQTPAADRNSLSGVDRR
jgi:tetratricopeptide (TPR) repeat protein